MIARLTGIIEQVGDGGVLLVLPGGVAHEVLIAAHLRARMQQAVGTTVSLHTLQYLESQGQGASFIPRLIGFASPAEREFFELLTSVKGLGNKRALRAMVSEPSAIARAIHDRDTRALQRLPEIGPKLAELIVHELKNKVARFAAPGVGSGFRGASAMPEPAAAEAQVEPKNGPRPAARATRGDGAVHPATPPVPPPPIRQSIETLIALGEPPFEAERLVARAIDRARAAGVPPPATTPELIAAAYASR